MEHCFNPQKVLVAGGAGFLGSHLCKYLVQTGHEVICMDNLSTGRQKNLEILLEHRRFKFIQHDISEPLPEYFSVDEIYNFACQASPVHYQNDPINTVKTNVLGAFHLLELAKLNQAKIFQSSTSEVYGDPLIHPQKETYNGNVNPLGIRACYDEGKRCAETLFFDYHRLYNVKIKVARIFNTYGPYMNPEDGRVISNFIIQALKNEPLTIYGQGSQTRSFCFVDDLMTGILALMNTSDDFIGPVNLGNDQEHSILEIAQKIIEISGSRSTIIFLPLPKDDPKKRCPDLNLAKKVLDYHPKINIDEGLKHTISYLETELQQQPMMTSSY